jgi:hypothetical protein
MDRHFRRNHVHHAKRDAQANSVVVVYKTLSPTFSGSVAGYSTANVTPSKATTTAAAPKVTTKTSASVKVETSTPAPKQTTVVAPTKQVTSPTVSAPKPTLANDKTEKPDDQEEEETDVQTTVSSSLSGFITQTTTLSSGSHTINSALNTASPTSTNAPVVNKSSGGANTAGIVGGSIAGILIFLAIIAFFYRKRQQKRMNDAYGSTEDEKFGVVTPHEKPSTGLAPLGASPRLSLRPVTQFMPNLNPAAASPVVKTGPATSHEIARKPLPGPLALAKSPMPAVSEAQASPTLSAFSDGFAAPGTPVAAVAGAIAAAGEKPSPVYRVQMDYIPVQPDELEIRAGALVRMIHEYDDGWALCIRMDRSQQGVCPRTCLSTRPVKPRPNPAPGSPVQNQARRGPPANGNGPYSPGPQYANQGPQRPYAQSTGSRPQTPTQQQQRQQSPMTPQQQSVPQITVSHSDNVDSPSQRQAARGPTFHAM